MRPLDFYAPLREWTNQLHEIREAFSGNVTQWIRAWGQIGLINVNYAGSTDPQAEHRISGQYSYGRQLGRIVEVLAPYVEAHQSEFSKAVDEKALNDFRDMAADIKRLKQASVSEIVARVQQWQGADDFNQKLDELLISLKALKKP